MALFRAYLGVVERVGGILLWPAVALHAIVALMLAGSWVAAAGSRPARKLADAASVHDPAMRPDDCRPRRHHGGTRHRRATYTTGVVHTGGAIDDGVGVGNGRREDHRDDGVFHVIPPRQIRSASPI
jgi:hypothetical protein